MKVEHVYPVLEIDSPKALVLRLLGRLEAIASEYPGQADPIRRAMDHILTADTILSEAFGCEARIEA